MATITATVVLDDKTTIQHTATLQPGDMAKVLLALAQKYPAAPGVLQDAEFLLGKQFEDTVVTIAHAVKQMQEQVAAKQAVANIQLIPLTIEAK